MRRTFALGAMAAPLLAGCADPSKIVDYKYRLKVVVGSGAHEWQGESVIRVRWRDTSGDLLRGYNRFAISVWAEAAIIDCGANNGFVFALLRRARFGSPVPYFSYPAYAFPRFAVRLFDASDDEVLPLLRRMASQTQEFDVPQEEWPMLVRFGDLSRPATVAPVEPIYLPPSHGLVARVKRVTMQITDAPVTRAILQKLPWLSSLSTNLGGGGGINVNGPLAQRLGVSDFRQAGFSF